MQQLGGIPKDIKETDATDDQTFDTQRYVCIVGSLLFIKHFILWIDFIMTF